MGNLTTQSVKNAKPGRHIDGAGLYLLVKPTGSRSWVLRVQTDGRRRDFGIGSWFDGKHQPEEESIPLLQRRELTLSEAREKAAALCRQAHSGVDLVAEKKKAKKVVRSFKDAALACHTALKRGWSESQAEKWLASLEDYAFPSLGDVAVDQVDAPLIRDMLQPIWHTIPNSARRVRQRVGAGRSLRRPDHRSVQLDALSANFAPVPGSQRCGPG